MHIARAFLKSISPYSQSRPHQTPKLDKEMHDDYERRTWRERLHYDDNGMVFIPPMAYKNNISEAAKFLSLQVKGKGKATWTKHFEAGVLVVEGLHLPVRKEDVKGEWLYLNADGRRGSGTRVMRCMPVIPNWEGWVTYHILDNSITDEIFELHLREAGSLIGIGRFRPRNNGYYGRFELKELVWE